ncbi:MAG: sialidase family protein [Acidobacteriota bacterium]
MRVTRAIQFVVGAGAVLALAGQPSAQSDRTATLAVPGRANSAPWVASQGRFVAVTWGAAADGKSDVYLATSDDQGGTFGAPVRVNTVLGDGRVSGEIPPRVALHAAVAGARPEVVVAWNAKDQGTEVKVARSRDFGRTFAAPVSLQASGAAGDRGWHSLALDDQGVAHVLWLDHRGLAGPGGEHVMSASGEHDGVAMAQKSTLTYATFGATAGAERVLTAGVCYCCKSAIVALPGGTLVSAWRHVYAGNLRDIAFTVSRDGGRTFAAPARVSEDGWAIDGCPDDGPALATGPDQAVHIVWPTVIPGAEPIGAIFYSTLRAAGGFAPRTRIPTLGGPKPSHPQVAVDGAGSLVAAWDESLAGVRTAAYVVGTRDAAGVMRFGTPTRLGGSGPSSYPVVASLKGGVVAAWTSGVVGSSVIRVRVIPITGGTATAAQ